MSGSVCTMAVMRPMLARCGRSTAALSGAWPQAQRVAAPLLQRHQVNPKCLQPLPSLGRGFCSLPPHSVLAMPALSPTMAQGNLAEWKVKEGEAVKSGDVIAMVRDSIRLHCSCRRLAAPVCCYSCVLLTDGVYTLTPHWGLARSGPS
eukprot:6000758-Pleurochrysis_carterae.AAC.2